MRRVAEWEQGLRHSNAPVHMLPALRHSRLSSSCSLPPHRAVDVAFHFALFHRLTFVVLLFAAADA